MERPKLRADLEQRRGASGELEGLRDPLLDRTIDLGPIARALIARFDTAPSVPELIASVAAELERPLAEVETSYRSFVLLCVLEGAGAATVERARRVLAEQRLDVIALDGARFQCQGSGACCQGYDFGPLAPGDRERLESHDLATLGPGPYFDERGDQTFLKTREDGRCIFLRDDHRCGVHGAFGAAAKPNLCQLYPIHALVTLDGIKVYDVGECATFATSARSGPLVADETARLRALLPAHPRIQHPIILLDSALPVDMGHLLAIQREAARRLAAPLPAAAALRSVTRYVRSAVGALAACPLELDGPERALSALEGLPSAPEGAPPRQAFEALVRVIDDLNAAYLRSAQTARAPGHETAFFAILAVALHVASSAADPELVLVHDHAAVARVAARGPDFDEPIRLALRSAVWGDQLLIERRVRPAIGRIATATFLVAIGAKLHARGRGASVVDATDASFAQSTVARMLRRPGAAALFVKHETDAWLLAEAAAAALDQGT